MKNRTYHDTNTRHLLWHLGHIMNLDILRKTFFSHFFSHYISPTTFITSHLIRYINQIKLNIVLPHNITLTINQSNGGLGLGMGSGGAGSSFASTASTTAGKYTGMCTILYTVYCICTVLYFILCIVLQRKAP
jgi:hypothetical protein